MGDDYAAADPRRLAGSLRQNAWIAEASAARLPGGTVVLRVREREPLAVIEGRGGPLGVDAEGRPFAVLDARDAVDLPRLRCESTPLPGEPDARIAEAIRVARSFPSRGLALPREIALGKEADPEGLVLAAAGHAGALRDGREGPRRARRDVGRAAREAARGGRRGGLGGPALPGPGGLVGQDRPEGVGVNRRRGAGGRRDSASQDRTASSGGPVSGGRRTWPRKKI